jgi:hypothetical protein
MRFPRIGLSSLAALLFVAAVAQPAAAARMLGDPSVSFSADSTITVGDRSFRGKVFAVPGSQRHEQSIGGIPQVIILRANDAKGWLVLPQLASYVEFNFAPAAFELAQPDLLSPPLGEETIDGHRATKYRAEHSARDGTLVDGYVWLTREGIPMRLDGMVTPARGGKPTPVHLELAHVREGAQPANLFVLPQNLNKLPSGMLGGLLGVDKPS